MLIAFACVVSLVLAGIVFKQMADRGARGPRATEQTDSRSRNREISDDEPKDATASPNDRSLTTSATKTPSRGSRKTSVADHDREVAEWVLSVVGSLKVVKDGATISLAPGAKLPELPFVVNRVDFTSRRDKDKVIVIDNELSRFAGGRATQTQGI